MASPDLIRDRAITAIVAARVAAARAEERAKRDAEWSSWLNAELDRMCTAKPDTYEWAHHIARNARALIEGADQ